MIHRVYLMEILKCVDLGIKSIGKFNLNNRKLWHPLILRNLVNKILEIHQRTIHRRVIQNKMHPSIISNMVKQALLLHQLTTLGNSFKTRHYNLPKYKCKLKVNTNGTPLKFFTEVSRLSVGVKIRN